MKKSINGTMKRYTLQELENDIKNNPQQIDLFEFGGCDCFL